MTFFEPSPFLRRDERKRASWLRDRRETYREQHTPTRYEQAATLERLRYRDYVRHGTLGRVLLRLRWSPYAWALAMLAYSTLALRTRLSAVGAIFVLYQFAQTARRRWGKR